ncbi:MAG: hypothetical protein WBC78_09515 [Candidatus Sulfotelmatobacter sp.]
MSHLGAAVLSRVVVQFDPNGDVITGDPLRLRSGQALGPLVKTRAFGMTPGG